MSGKPEIPRISVWKTQETQNNCSENPINLETPGYLYRKLEISGFFGFSEYLNVAGFPGSSGIPGSLLFLGSSGFLVSFDFLCSLGFPDHFPGFPDSGGDDDHIIFYCY